MPKQRFVTTIHPNTAEIYNAINYTKRLNNLRQEDLAKVLKVQQNTISYHLKHHSFDQDQLNNLLDFLGLEIRVCPKD